jgi:hypothetical protein
LRRDWSIQAALNGHAVLRTAFPAQVLSCSFRFFVIEENSRTRLHEHADDRGANSA